MGKWIALGVVGVLVLFIWGSHSGLVGKDLMVAQRMSEVQNQEKRRHDLIPNLVATVQGYAAHEKGVFEAVTKARADVGKFTVNVDPTALANNPELLKQFAAAQEAMKSSLSRLLAVAEAYPTLKANEGFITLQKQLEGTENRIAVARRDYIIAVREYNQSTRTFPSNVVAGMFGYTQKPNFEIADTERQVPTVKF